MSRTYSDDQLRLAAWLYDLDGLGQTEVARFVKASQAKCSRLLALARERGIVRISVADYEPRNDALEQQVRRRVGLHSVAVIRTGDRPPVEDARRLVGHFGPAWVAIAGGRTLRELVQLLPEDNRLNLSVVQAMESIDATVGPVDAFELGHALARRWGGTFSTLSTPAFVPDRKTRRPRARRPSP